MVGFRAATFRLAESGREARVEPFCLDATEVTAGAFAECVREGTCREPETCPGCTFGAPGKDRFPVNSVDWKQATSFCESLGKRLPSEEEWEWAARGAERAGRHPWGDEAPRGQLCWDGEGSDSGQGNRRGPCEVGSHPAGNSAQGVADLAGNVWEWTSSPYEGGRRIYRGGGWSDDNPTSVTAAASYWAHPTFRRPFLGFRCARAP
jgi:formylglycine-generating enzyme required for sulfatase activity